MDRSLTMHLMRAYVRNQQNSAKSSYRGEDRRKYFRRRNADVIDFECVDEEGFGEPELNSTHLCDISEGGLRLIHRHDVPVGTKVWMSIHLMNGRHRLECVGRTQWCRPVNPNTKLWHQVGVSFTELSDCNVKLIRKFVDKNRH